MNILNPAFKYTNAADSSKPGYLQAKFDAIRAQQAAQKPANVTYAALDGMPMIDASRDPVTGKRLWRAK